MKVIMELLQPRKMQGGEGGGWGVGGVGGYQALGTLNFYPSLKNEILSLVTLIKLFFNIFKTSSGFLFQFEE